MDKRKKYFCVVAMVLILLSGYGKISDSAFRMRVTRMIAGEGMFRLVAAQYRQKVAEPVAETASDRSEKEDRPRVALTFDDGPACNIYTSASGWPAEAWDPCHIFSYGKKYPGK